MLNGVSIGPLLPPLVLMGLVCRAPCIGALVTRAPCILYFVLYALIVVRNVDSGWPYHDINI